MEHQPASSPAAGHEVILLGKDRVFSQSLAFALYARGISSFCCDLTGNIHDFLQSLVSSSLKRFSIMINTEGCQDEAVEILSRIRGWSTRPPVIVLYNGIVQDFFPDSLSQQGITFLEKPASLDEIVDKLKIPEPAAARGEGT